MEFALINEIFNLDQICFHKKSCVSPPSTLIISTTILILECQVEIVHFQEVSFERFPGRGALIQYSSHNKLAGPHIITIKVILAILDV